MSGSRFIYHTKYRLGILNVTGAWSLDIHLPLVRHALSIHKSYIIVSCTEGVKIYVAPALRLSVRHTAVVRQWAANQLRWEVGRVI